jgi:tetratricopeptide (TPR) repeat protein
MPAHIYERTGNFDGARAQNAAGAKADEDFAAATGTQGIYMMMYYSHNLHFGAISASMQGHCAEAKQFAGRLAENLRPALNDMPMVQPFVAMPLAISVRCKQWDDVLAASEPAAQTPTLKAFWLYSRGIALTVRGKTSEASTLEQQLAAIDKATSRDDVLAARIAAAKGDKPGAIALLRDAVAVQDKLLYDEPADWYYPVRESLGGMLLESGDSKGAELVFREDLERNPRNPRSLFGLAEALARQHRDYEASWVKQQLQSAWQGADVELKVEDL